MSWLEVVADTPLEALDVIRVKAGLAQCLKAAVLRTRSGTATPIGAAALNLVGLQGTGQAVLAPSGATGFTQTHLTVSAPHGVAAAATGLLLELGRSLECNTTSLVGRMTHARVAPGSTVPNATYFYPSSFLPPEQPQAQAPCDSDATLNPTALGIMLAIIAIAICCLVAVVVCCTTRDPPPAPPRHAGDAETPGSAPEGRDGRKAAAATPPAPSPPRQRGGPAPSTVGAESPQRRRQQYHTASEWSNSPVQQQPLQPMQPAAQHGGDGPSVSSWSAADGASGWTSPLGDRSPQAALSPQQGGRSPFYALHGGGYGSTPVSPHIPRDVEYHTVSDRPITDLEPYRHAVGGVTPFVGGGGGGGGGASVRAVRYEDIEVDVQDVRRDGDTVVYSNPVDRAFGQRRALPHSSRGQLPL